MTWRAKRWLTLLLATAGALPWVASLACAGTCRPLFAWICHQQPGRSLLLGAEPMVVCSRCAGIYLGMLLAALLSRRFGATTLRNLTISFLAVNILDWLAGLAGAGVVHPWRLAVGAALGWSASAWLLVATDTLTAPGSVAKTE